MTTLSRRRMLLAPAFASLTRAAVPPAKDLRHSQLFLDDYWIDETLRLERVWQAADIVPDPVLRPEALWEGVQLVMFGSVFRLGDEWRMYYMTYNKPAPNLLCMATSRDGMRWERPKLGVAEWGGNKANNIVWSPAPGRDHDGPTICHDPADARAPWKMIYYGFGQRGRGEYVATSLDGLHWEHRPEPVLTSTGDRTNVMDGRDHRGRFVAFLRHRTMMTTHRARTIWRSESDDFVRWSEPELILQPDLQEDPNTELYGMAGFPYAGMYLGMLERWYDNPDVIEVQPAWSHDGREWRRPAVRHAFIGPKFPWNRAWNSCASTPPQRVGNQLFFYFGARTGAHGVEIPRSTGSIGLAVTGVDQFAAIRADFNEGRLVTKPMTWPGGELVLTCSNTRYPAAHPRAGGGEIAVEIREENQQPVAGYSGEQRAKHNTVSPSAGQQEQAPVRWSDGRRLDALKGRRIRLVFLLRDARLYSFRAQG
jgi:hypothetical protein